MICPNCKKETTSLIRICQNCKADLEKYRAERNNAIEGTGEIDFGAGLKIESMLINIGPIGGVILMAVSILWFFAGLMNNSIYFYPPVLFIIGIIGFFAGIKKAKRRRALNEKKKRGEILD
jgi:hypothetical protein